MLSNILFYFLNLEVYYSLLIVSILRECKDTVPIPGDGLIIWWIIYANLISVWQEELINSTSTKKVSNLGSWARENIQEFKDNENWSRFVDKNRKRRRKIMNLITAARANASNEDLIVHYALPNGKFAWFWCRVCLYIFVHMFLCILCYICLCNLFAYTFDSDYKLLLITLA